MNLDRIQIENFRSIKSECIIFEHNCLILLGKNEAGKSNILKAIAAPFGEYKVTNKDKRKRIENEKIENYHIRAIFKLEENDFKEIIKRFKTQHAGYELISFKNNKNLIDFLKAVFYEFIIKIKIGDGEIPDYYYWTYNYKKDFELEFEVYINPSNEINILSSGNKINLEIFFFNIIKTYYKENAYKCHYWKYESSLLLPASVDINEFIDNPPKFKSLENIFILSNRENIKKEFLDAKSQDGDYENLLDQVSKSVTSTFQKIWTDFRDTKIQLRQNGEEITIKVANKAKYSFEDRSDGFKKFISILLMLSTQARANKIGDKDIILIDEPDQSLYPTSAKLLKDELLKISEKSKLIYTTHSQYMIDSDCIERHRIVEKKDDITTIAKQNTNASFCKDELLRRAIGSSIFECLQDKNLIFEGWLDKELFLKYCKFHKRNSDFKNIGVVYLGGISGVESLVQLLILANKKFLIVSDSDETSMNKKNEFSKNYPEYLNSWLSYSDVSKEIQTMEDYFAIEYLTKMINSYVPGFVYKNDKKAIINIGNAVVNDKELKQEIKNKLIQSIEKKYINENYGNYINRLKQLLSN